MQKNIIKKGLVIAVILLFIYVNFQTIIVAEKTTSVEKNNQENNYKDYRNCRIRESYGIVVGRAFLFPGFLFSGWSYNAPGVVVIGASGILIHRYSDWSGVLYFNEDHYYNDWKKVYVFLFTGYFSNHWNFLNQPLFEINGIAKFVRVYIE